jgi:hypothetical protein
MVWASPAIVDCVVHAEWSVCLVFFLLLMTSNVVVRLDCGAEYIVEPRRAKCQRLLTQCLLPVGECIAFFQSTIQVVKHSLYLVKAGQTADGECAASGLCRQHIIVDVGHDAGALLSPLDRFIKWYVKAYGLDWFGHIRHSKRQLSSSRRFLSS